MGGPLDGFGAAGLTDEDVLEAGAGAVMAADQPEGASLTELTLKNGEDGRFNATCIFHDF